MLISERLVYLELPKTACSHIRDLLKLLIGGKIEGKHNRLPANLIQKDKHIIGSIRNPWDWYVSLWAFGCDGKGSLYNRLVSQKFRGNGLSSLKNEKITISPFDILLVVLENLRKKEKEYQYLYSDSKDPEKFRKWLRIILDSNSNRKYSFGDRYAFSPLSSYAGIYTYYYLQLFSKKIEGIYDNTLRDENRLESFYQENNLMDFIIKFETLEKDLIKILNTLKYDLNKQEIQTIMSFKPHWHNNKQTNTNSSSRIKDLAYYYDQESRDLVAEREKFIVQKYSYLAPVI